MYSRSTSKKNVKGQRFNGTVPSEDVRETIKNDGDVGINEHDTAGEYKANALPLPPPNYRGMIYDKKSAFFEYTEAEGIERLAKNDASYCTEKMRRGVKKPDRKPFSHFDPPIFDCGKEEGESGLKKLVSGLRQKDFQPEDILICAMIMLMLNSKSEDDILMVLVLMLLL